MAPFTRLSVKENQPSLCNAIGDAFLDVDEKRAAARFGEPAERDNAGHGRLERRRCWVCADPELIEPLSSTWKGLRSIVVIESERTVEGGETTLDRHWYISSRKGSAEFFLSARREHWSVENGLHWVLEVAFREDECRVREGDGAENLSVLRRMVDLPQLHRHLFKSQLQGLYCRVVPVRAFCSPESSVT